MVKVPTTRLGVALFVRSIDPKDVYEPLGISKSYFSQLMWGRRSSKKTCEKIAKHLGLPLEEIYEKPQRKRKE